MVHIVQKVTSLLGAVIVAVPLTACSGRPGNHPSNSETVPVDVGTGVAVPLSLDKLKIGLFMNALSNKWHESVVDGVTDETAKLGWDSTVNVADFDTTKQLNQLQIAVTNQTYDAIIVAPVDGVAECKMLTQVAPEAGVLVITIGTTLCGRDLETGQQMWAPGSYSYGALAPSREYIDKWFAATASANPGPQTVAVFVGPEVNGATIATKKAGDAFVEAHPDFRIADYINTDFTAPNTFATGQAYLQAHPDTTLVMSIYSPDVSRGVVHALESLDMSGDVVMTDMGGSQFTFDEINRGTIELTMPYYPYSQGTLAVQAIKDAQDGVVPKRIYDEIPGGIATAPAVTAQNVSEFQPQF